MKTETWLGHNIRFVDKQGEWWAVLADVASALDLNARWVRQRLSKDVVSNHIVPTAGGKQEMLIVSEYGVYETVFECRKPEAKEFKRWVFDIIKTLRQSSGLEGFQIFRMLDKEFLTAAEVAPVLGIDPQDLRSQAQADSVKLGFPVIVTGSRVRIPREGFLFFCRYGRPAKIV